MKAKWPMLHAASLSARLLSKHEAPPAQQLPYSLRNRNFGNPPLPVSSFFDPKRLKQRHKHRLPKHKRLHFSQLEDKARQRLANNPYARILTSPIRTCPLTQARLPRSLLLELFSRRHPEPPHQPVWLPLTLYKATKPDSLSPTVANSSEEHGREGEGDMEDAETSTPRASIFSSRRETFSPRPSLLRMLLQKPSQHMSRAYRQDPISANLRASVTLLHRQCAERLARRLMRTKLAQVVASPWDLRSSSVAADGDNSSSTTAAAAEEKEGEAAACQEPREHAAPILFISLTPAFPRAFAELHGTFLQLCLVVSILRRKIADRAAKLQRGPKHRAGEALPPPYPPRARDLYAPLDLPTVPVPPDEASDLPGARHDVAAVNLGELLGGEDEARRVLEGSGWERKRWVAVYAGKGMAGVVDGLLRAAWWARDVDVEVDARTGSLNTIVSQQLAVLNGLEGSGEDKVFGQATMAAEGSK